MANWKDILTLGIFDYKMVLSLLNQSVANTLSTTDILPIQLEEKDQTPVITKLIQINTGTGTSTTSAEAFQRCMDDCLEKTNQNPDIFKCPPGIFPPDFPIDVGPIPVQNGNSCECGNQQSYFEFCKEAAIMACATRLPPEECTTEKLNEFIDSCYDQSLEYWIKAFEDGLACKDVVEKFKKCATRCDNLSRGRARRRFPGYEHPFFDEPSSGREL
jgi:hypothetical protein